MNKELFQPQKLNTIGSLFEINTTEHDVGLKEFLTVTFPDMPSRGLVSVDTMQRVIAGLYNYTDPRTIEPTQYENNASLWLRGCAVWDAIYGKDPYQERPRELIKRYIKGDSKVALPSNVVRTIANYTPDIDLRAFFFDEVRAYDVQKVIETTLGFAPTQYKYRGNIRKISFIDPRHPKRLIQATINDRFGDPEGKQKRMKIKIKFIDGNRRWAMDIAQDTEKDEGPFNYEQSDMRLNAQRTLLDVLGTFPVSMDGGHLVVTVNRALDATGVHKSFNPFYPATLMKRGYSHVYSSLIRAAAKATSMPFEYKFLSEQLTEDTNDRSEDHLFDLLLKDATQGDAAMCNPTLVDMPTSGSFEENNINKRALPLAHVDITYALIRNPFRFLRLLFAMRNLCVTLPLGNFNGDQVLESMRALLAERTGQRIDTLHDASKVYEQLVLTPGTDYPTGLEMLAEITQNQDVFALFTPDASRLPQK